MSQQTSGRIPAGSAGSTTDPSMPQVAREEVAEVGRSSAEAGREVAGVAADQTGHVTQEARRQAKDLLGEARGQAMQQARLGQQRATEGLHALATELHQMADGGERHGPASDLVQQAAGRVGDVAEWLSRREPGDLVEEVRRLARRRPGSFLIGAAIAGVMAGRLTRGAVDAGGGGNHAPRNEQPGTEPRHAQVPPTDPALVPYDSPAGAGLPAQQYAPGPVQPGPQEPIAPGPAGYPPAPPGSGSSSPTAPPTAAAPQTEATTVGEYVQDLERGTTQQGAHDPRAGENR